MKPYTPVLKYWFGEDLSNLKSDEYVGNYKLWYGGDSNTDNFIKENFGSLLIKAEKDELEEWKKEIQGSLALIILLDQFSRNIYRGSGKMFQNDAKALSITLNLLKNNLNELNELSVPERQFIYMPLMHAEDLEVLKKCLECFQFMVDTAKTPKQKKASEMAYKFALEHFEIIEKFGRYPHRNELLGRDSTQAEKEYLAKDVPSFASSVKATPADENK